jgi:hypothetical protein
MVMLPIAPLNDFIFFIKFKLKQIDLFFDLPEAEEN